MARDGDSRMEPWLKALGLGQYAAAFAINDVTLDVLPLLTGEDLRELGVASIGHRRLILAAAASGAAQAGEDEAASPTRPPPPGQAHAAETGERRLLTVLFCDLVDSTALAAAVDAEEFVNFIRLFQQDVGAAIQSTGGHVSQFLGDGIMAVFGYPTAAEHDAERAINGALAALSAVARLPQVSGQQVQVRIGIATGLSVVGRAETGGQAETGPIGETSNLASRLQSVAPPGGIVVSQQTRALAGNLFDWVDLGAHALKGVAAPVQVWQVLGSSGLASRFEALRDGGRQTRFVGREAETIALKVYLEKAWGRRGGVALVTGEPGIGKSRLVRHVLEGSRRGEAAGEGPLVLQCSPFQNAVAFSPLRYLVLKLTGLRVQEPPEVTTGRLRDFLAADGLAEDENVRELENLLDLPGPAADEAARATSQDARQRLMQLLGQVLLARVKPSATLIVEDAQWLDPSTSALMIDLMPRLAAQGVAVLATARPGPRPDWLAEAHVWSISLDRLSPDEVLELLRYMASAETGLPPQVAATIAERSDGVPIYAEELARSYLEHLSVAGPAEAHVPATLSESILARLDRLKHGRRLAPLAAAIGREFPVAALQAVAGLPPEDFEKGIDELASSGILVRTESMYGRSIRFRDNLVRDTAYGLLLRRERPAMHARIADALETSMPMVTKALPQVIAHHRSEAGQMEQATEAWKLAAQDAWRRSAYEEAADYFGRAVETNQAAPDDARREEGELELRLSRLSALVCARGYQAAETVRENEIVSALAARLNSGQDMFRALCARWVQTASANNFKAALSFALQVRQLAEQGREVDRLIATRMCATSYLFRGELQPAIEHYRMFMATYDEERHGPAMKLDHADHMLMVMVGLSEALTLTGAVDEACQWRAQALASARASNRSHDHFQTLVYAGCFHPLLLERTDLLAEGVRDLTALIETKPLPFWSGFGALFSGLLLARTADRDRGIDRALLGVQQLIDIKNFGSWWLLLPVGDCIASGRLDDAARLLSRVASMRRLGDLRTDPQYLLLDARLHLQRSDDHAIGRAKLMAALERAASTGAGLILPQIRAEVARLDG